jgi:hypothetical protein
LAGTILGISKSLTIHSAASIPIEDPIKLPENGTSLTLLQQVYCNPSLPLPVRMRAAIAALPFETPKLAVTAYLDGGLLGEVLERAIKRSGKVIEVEAIKASLAIEGPKPEPTVARWAGPVPDRRFRRW